MSVQDGDRTGRKLETLLKWLGPFERAIVERTAGEVFRRLEEVKPIVTEVNAELEKTSRWEKVCWFPLSRATDTEAVLSVAEPLLENAEEAEAMVMIFAKAFLTIMDQKETPLRWEDAQRARMLLLFACRALRRAVARERERLEKEGA